jgi:MbtH protein
VSIDREDCEFDVVVNDQGQYSIWPTFHDIPAGWHAVGVRGNRQTCCDYIDRTWTDLRPRRLREAMGS